MEKGDVLFWAFAGIASLALLFSVSGDSITVISQGGNVSDVQNLSVLGEGGNVSDVQNLSVLGESVLGEVRAGGITSTENLNMTGGNISYITKSSFANNSYGVWSNKTDIIFGYIGGLP